jgi:hypothetical protein
MSLYLFSLPVPVIEPGCPREEKGNIEVGVCGVITSAPPLAIIRDYYVRLGWNLSCPIQPLNCRCGIPENGFCETGGPQINDIFPRVPRFEKVEQLKAKVGRLVVCGLPYFQIYLT